jgi:hypothetical protein
MSRQAVRTREPFLAVAAGLAIVTLAVFRLPESFVAVLERNALLSGSSAGWAVRILTIVAFGQAAYAGFMVVRPERVAAALEREPALRAAGSRRLARSIAWNAAGIAALTMVYGLAAFAITGERASFWLFVVIGIAQLAWYYGLTGTIIEWLQFQPSAQSPEQGSGDTGASYCPPIARGLIGAAVPPRV